MRRKVKRSSSLKKLWHKVDMFFHDTKVGIRNLIKWTPVVWKDRQWDEHFIYALLHKKFTEMEKFYKSDDCSNANWKHTVRQIKVARTLCKRLIEDAYTMNALTDVEAKYGELKMHSEKEPGRPWMRLIFDETPEESKARMRAYKHSDYMKKQDIDYLFKLMAKNIQDWWD